MNELEEARRIIAAADADIARLFEKRMEAVRRVAGWKRERGLPVYDPAREEELIRKNAPLIADPDLREYYARFQRDTMAVSRAYQERLIFDAEHGGETGDGGTVLHLNLRGGSYPVVLGSDTLGKADRFFRLNRKVLIVTDEGVPGGYAETLASRCAHPVLVTVPQGETSKSPARFEELLRVMLENGFTRSDCAAAVGGGVVGDLTGFAASAYMRGIDFYCFPTTILSAVDASIGGKTAVNLGGVKNAVGAFRQPKGVLIDPETLRTLPPRQIACGLAEAVKAALCFDEAGFALFEEKDPADLADCLGTVVENALRIKKRVVEQDETERGLRRVLNFGHTLGHGIESLQDQSGDALNHGECVALGMLPMCSSRVRARLEPVLKKLRLPVSCPSDPAFTDRMMRAVLHDKKRTADGRITAVLVEEVGQYALKDLTPAELRSRFTDCYGQGGSSR